jgi:hypothetical protein
MPQHNSNNTTSNTSNANKGNHGKSNNDRYLRNQPKKPTKGIGCDQRAAWEQRKLWARGIQ